MRTYFLIIKVSQLILLGISIIILTVLPGVLVLYPESVSSDFLYFLAHSSLFLVMLIRPLADVLAGVNFIRPLVILRKGVGVFSASIIVSFIIAKIIISPADYFSSFTTSAYWSLVNFALLAHLADISAVILLITSNNLSKRILGANWKRVQKLSYLYFFGSGLYVFLTYQDYTVLSYMVIVTLLTSLAFLVNRSRRLKKIVNK